jgi:hypothetical protein
MTVDVGEAIVSTLESICETFMVKAEQVHDGGLEVMNMDFVFSDVKA